MRHLIIALATLDCAATMAVAGGGVIDEIEPNDSLLTAQDLSFVGGLAIEASLGAGDVDWYSLQLGGPSLLMIQVLDFTPRSPFDNDSILALYDASGSQFAFNDDTESFLSSLSVILFEGTYFIAVSGFGDAVVGRAPDEWDGSHSEVFEYVLVVKILVPAPTSIALLGFAGMANCRRRRR